jgi:hypothetical protein
MTDDPLVVCDVFFYDGTLFLEGDALVTCNFCICVKVGYS